MNKTLGLITLIILLLAFVIMFIEGVINEKKRKKQIEYELDHPKAPEESEYRVRVAEMKCSTVTRGTSQHPVSDKEFYVLFEEIDDDKNATSRAIPVYINQEIYQSLEVGKCGFIAFTGDAFIGFVDDKEKGSEATEEITEATEGIADTIAKATEKSAE